MNRKTGLLAAIFASAMLTATAGALAQDAKDIEIATVQPLSGPWARLGEESKIGAELAVKQINESGGIKALGGAKLKLVVVDGGDSPEKFKNATQRLVSEHPNLAGGMGAYVSSFTLAVTEVTERAGIPWLTLSYSPTITDRGFKHVFATSPTAVIQAEQGMPAIIDMAKQATGKAPTKVAIVMDNTPSPVGFTSKMHGDGLKQYGLELVTDEQFTPPLSDCGALMQKVRASRPDFLLLLLTATPDIKLCLEKLTELGLPRTRLPIVNNGGVLGSPDLLQVMNKDLLEGSLFITANWGAKGQEDFIKTFESETGEKWVTQDSISNYGHVMLLATAMEMAKSADPEKITEALHSMDISDGAAKFFPGGHVKFAENGLREDAPLVIVQWQDGVPLTVWPKESALADPIWPH